MRNRDLFFGKCLSLMFYCTLQTLKSGKNFRQFSASLLLSKYCNILFKKTEKYEKIFKR